MRNNQYLRLKDIWGGLLLFIISISLCGCSQSAKSEREIIADLQQNPAFISETVKIRDYEIIKRQTRRNNYSDLVYLTVYVNEDKFKCTFSYIMEYTLYNDGWILENVTQYLDGPWSIDGLSSDQLSSDVTDNDFYFDDYILEIEDSEILNEGWGL